MFDTRLIAFLLNDLLPKLTKGVHSLILQQNLSDRFVGLIPFIDDRPQALYQQPFDEVATEHEVLIADLSLHFL